MEEKDKDEEIKMLVNLKQTLQGMNVLLSSFENDLKVIAHNYSICTEMNNNWAKFIDNKPSSLQHRKK